MNLQVPVSELQKKSLFVATPMYGGQCFGSYTKSILDLSRVCQAYGIQVQFSFIFNESLITRARNYMVDEFLRSPHTHMMFIDSDIGFNPQDVIAMMALQAAEPENYEIIGGPYPKKCIAWEKIKRAVDKGFADKEPNNLERYVGDYVFNPIASQNQIPISEPAQIMETGTGFMMIKRNVFEKYEAAYPEYHYKPDHVRSEHFDGSREIMAYFDCIIDPDSKRYLSEDYMFCQNVRKIGCKVWLCPWISTQHVGMMVFGGSLADLAMIGASATADVSQLKKENLLKK